MGSLHQDTWKNTKGQVHQEKGLSVAFGGPRFYLQESVVRSLQYSGSAGLEAQKAEVTCSLKKGHHVALFQSLFGPLEKSIRKVPRQGPFFWGLT